MTIVNVSQASSLGLPHSLRTAQEAIQLPEVQHMLRRLAEYNLGIFMPHMHDAQSGQFRALPDEVTQVESGLEVSFQSAEEIASQTAPFVPVGWFWRAGAATPSAACEMLWKEELGDADRTPKHKPHRDAQGT